MMDVSRFGLEFNPFLKNSKEILVETAQYREALFRLSYLAKTRGPLRRIGYTVLRL